MQKIKKVIALILTLCMLIGMPLCLEVVATGDPNTVPSQQTAGLVQALLQDDDQVQLYFNCRITANPAPVAYIALVNNQGLCAYIDPINGTYGSGTIVSIWDANYDTTSNVVTLCSPQTRNYHPTCDTVSEILDLANKTGLTPIVRLRESKNTTKDTVDGLNVESLGVGILSTPDKLCGEDGRIFNGANSSLNIYDYVDVTITTAEQAPSLLFVESNSTMIRPIFSEPMYWDGRAANANPTHLRVVNSKGQIMYTDGKNYSTQKSSGYYAIGNFNNVETDDLGLYRNTFFTSGAASSAHSLNAIPYESTTRDWTSTYNDCVTRCAALNQSRFGGERYSVALVIEENEDTLDLENGDYANNFRIDGMWTKALVPLTATHSDENGDRVVVPLCSSADIESQAAATGLLTLKSVTVSSTPGQPDRVLVEFSKPVNTITRTNYAFAGIRLYESNGWVPSVKVDNTDVSVQWSVNKWEKYNTSGTQWIGEMETRLTRNTLAQIEDWLVINNHATRTGNALTMKDGKRLEFAFVGAYGSANDRMVTEMRAADGTPLFANDSPFLAAGEDRASISHSAFTRLNAVTIEKATVYADKYVIIEFNQDVTWDRSLFYNGLCIYDNVNDTLAGIKDSAYGPYNPTDYPTALQKAFTSWEYYGNRKDIVVATLADGDYAWLADHLTKANAVDAGRYSLSLRLEDYPEKISGNRLHAIDGITAAGSKLAQLYTSSTNTRSILYTEAAHHGEESANAQLVQARLVAENQAILSFSTAVTNVNHSHIRLVSGNNDYPATSATVDENDENNVIVTFNGVTLHDGLGIRINGGADYRIPSSVIKTKNGAVVYANETAFSAYLPAEVTEAVATVKLNDTYYIDPSSAWEQQKEGDTITLTKDIDMTASVIMVLPAGVTLDLNGHTLTVPYVFSFGQIVDNADNGLLAIADNGTRSFAHLQAENRQLPLYDKKSGGYRFFDYDIENLGSNQFKTDDVISSVAYGIRLHFTNPDAYILLQDAKNAAVSLSTDLVLRFPNKTATRLTYIFNSEILSEFAAEYHPTDAPNKAIIITIMGFNKIAQDVMTQPSALIVDAHSTLHAACGVEHDSTTERILIGITPAQAAVNWINSHIEANDLVSFNYNGTKANLNEWTKTDPNKEQRTADRDWTSTVSYTNGQLTLSLEITFNKEHASLEWVGNWKYTGYSNSKRIANVQILNASFPIQGATMTTARQGGQNYIYDYQPYSVDLTKTQTYSMQNTGGRSSQGAWPYFDLTSKQNTYGIMGAIGWTGNWKCSFTNNGDSVTVAAGMQNTNYQMMRNESLRTPSVVIQFFKGTQDDGHNAWRQLILDQYTPDNVNTYTTDDGKDIPCVPISINTWGGWGEDRMIDTLTTAKNSGQYFEYQWVDAGWYGEKINDQMDTVTINGETDNVWHVYRGSWYYNPGFSATDKNGNSNVEQEEKGFGGFDKLNEWHKKYKEETGRDLGLIVWFEPCIAEKNSVMAINGNKEISFGFLDTTGYDNPIFDATWKNQWFFTDKSEIDYGEPEALNYVKKMVLHYLDDMEADVYRQDFNTKRMTECWQIKDNEQSQTRIGVAEIQYVTGHYDLLDTVLANGYMIDNCASGGRLLDIEMMKRSIPMWRIDYSSSDSSTVASGIRSQGAGIAWWLPISGATGSKEGLSTKYTFRSSMASGITMGALENATFANKMLKEMRDNREMMLGDYYILKQGLHEGLKQGDCPTHNVYCWIEADSSKDYTNSTNAAYEFYLEEEGRGYVVAFRPTYSTDDRDTVLLKGLDRHADYLVTDADTGASAVYTGRYLMEQGLDLSFPDIRTSRMIYFTKQ